MQAGPKVVEAKNMEAPTKKVTSRRTQRRRVTAGRTLGVLVGVFLLASCVPRAHEWVGDSGPRVVVLGDSITWLSEYGALSQASTKPYGTDRRMLSDQLAGAGFTANVAAFPGARSEEMTPALASIPGQREDILVLNIGSNDLRVEQGQPKPDPTTVVDNVVATIDASTAKCSVVFTLDGTFAFGLRVSAPRYDAALREMAASRNDVVLEDWTVETLSHPEYLGPDGIHPSPTGVQRYRDMVVEGAKACAAQLDGSASPASARRP